MSDISPQLVRELREKTNAGMMDCKRALTEAGGDMTKAEDILRAKGIASAGKKASRSAKEGIVASYIHLQGNARAVLSDSGRLGVANPGAHGFTEILYALTSAANNNGSAFAGLSANTPFYNGLLGLAMLVGRFWVMIATLAIAGSLAAKDKKKQG